MATTRRLAAIPAADVAGYSRLRGDEKGDARVAQGGGSNFSGKLIQIKGSSVKANTL
jgi:hypothetical protein